MPTIVVIPQPIRANVDEAESPHIFSSVTTEPFDPPIWNLDGQLEVTFPTVDLTATQMNEVMRIAQQQDTMPTDPPPAPVAPSTSPTPKVSALGIGSLRISWTPVTNETPVMYDVYLDDTTPVVVDAAHLLESTAASMVSTGTLPDDTELTAGTTYYAVIQARSEDQLGPVSAEGSGTPVQVTSPDIAASAINAEHISANSIDGDKLTGTVILGSDITTALEGERHGFSAAEGFYSYGPSGEQVLSAKGGDVAVTGDITATSLNVTQGATWAGENVGAPDASTMMADSITAPGSPPTVEWMYDTITLDGEVVAGDIGAARSGLVWHADHWWVASVAPNPSTDCLLKFDAAGAFVARFDVTDSTHAGTKSLTLLGSTFYSAGVSLIRKFEATTGAYQGDLAVGSTLFGPFAWGSDGTNLIYAHYNSAVDDGLIWQKYDTAGNKVGGEVHTGDPVHPYALIVGTFDLPASRYVIGGPNSASVFDSAGTLYPNYRFPCENTLGLAWRPLPDGHFYSLRSPTEIRVHTDELLGEGKNPELYVGATWHNSTNGYETAVSPRGKRTFAQRAQQHIRLPVPCPGLGGASDPDGARFYIGRSSGRTKLQWMPPTIAVSPGGFAEGVVDIANLPAGTADASTPPPATNSFPSDVTSPYEHFSQAVVPGTLDPQTMLKGDGFARVFGLVFPWVVYRRVTDIAIPNSAATRVGMATEVETDPDITYDAPNDDWTVTHAGVYRVTAQCRWQGGTGGHRTLNVWTDDGITVENVITASETSGAARGTSQGSRPVRLAAGTKIFVEAFQNTGTAVDITGGNGETFIAIERLGA